MATAKKTTIEITPENRNQFGGDCALLETMRDKHGNVFNITRDQMDYLDTMSPLRGDLIYKADPTFEYNTVWFEENDSPNSRKDWMYFTVNKGFEVAQYDEWDIRPELRNVWHRDAAGRITLGPSGKGSATILMVRSKQRWAEEQRKLHRVTDQISRAGAVQNAADELGRGAMMTETFEPEYRRG